MYFPKDLRIEGDFIFHFKQFIKKRAFSRREAIIRRIDQTIAHAPVLLLPGPLNQVIAGQHGGRLRKYYHITEEGLQRIEDFKLEWEEILSIYQFVMREDDGDA